MMKEAARNRKANKRCAHEFLGSELPVDRGGGHYKESYAGIKCGQGSRERIGLGDDPKTEVGFGLTSLEQGTHEASDDDWKVIQNLWIEPSLAEGPSFRSPYQPHRFFE